MTGGTSPSEERHFTLRDLQIAARDVLEREDMVEPRMSSALPSTSLPSNYDASSERVWLGADKTFHERQLAHLPESATLTRASSMARPGHINALLAKLSPEPEA